MRRFALIACCLIVLVMGSLILQAAQQPNAPWGLDRIDQHSGTDGLYNYDNDGTGVFIYVVDTGVSTTHPDLAGRVIVGQQFLNGSGGSVPPDEPPELQSFQDCGQPDAHGTAVASIAAGTNAGVAKGATIISVTAVGCDGYFYTGDVADAINWVQADWSARGRPPAVLNLSLGGPQSAIGSNWVDGAVENAIASGLTVVIAAGNTNVDAGTLFPAHVPEAVTVSASAQDDSRAYFSISQTFASYGSVVDIFAPGVGIYVADSRHGGYTEAFEGTSAAAPFVTGVAARYLQLHPTASPAEVANAILGAATLNVIGNAGPGSQPNLLYSAFLDGGQPPPPPTGRYKLDGNGNCYWDPNDSGPDQCSPATGRWKLDGNGNCYWDPNDSGPNQCEASKAPPLALAISPLANSTLQLTTPSKETSLRGSTQWQRVTDLPTEGFLQTSGVGWSSEMEPVGQKVAPFRE